MDDPVEIKRDIIVGVLLLVFLKVFYAIGFVVSGSMEPTMAAGDLFWGTRMINVQALERGDVVGFHFGGAIYMKRIVGMPGDTIVFFNGEMYINDILQDESAYIDGAVKTLNNPGQDEFLVPEDCYFVLGDNRENSYDSRSWDHAYIHVDDMVARVDACVRVPMLSDLLAVACEHVIVPVLSYIYQ